LIQDFASGGLRLGFLVTKNEQLRLACKMGSYVIRGLTHLRAELIPEQEIAQPIPSSRHDWDGHPRRPRICGEFHCQNKSKSRSRLQIDYLYTGPGWDQLCQGRVSHNTPIGTISTIRLLSNLRNAGFFIYVDLSPFLPDGISTQEQEFALAQKLVDAGVFLHPGEEHGKDAGWFRLVFSQEESALKEGLNRYVLELFTLRLDRFCHLLTSIADF
jgi:1-aminocyclopropane-1-carboxylate synthase